MKKSEELNIKLCYNFKNRILNICEKSIIMKDYDEFPDEQFIIKDNHIIFDYNNHNKMMNYGKILNDIIKSMPQRNRKNLEKIFREIIMELYNINVKHASMFNFNGDYRDDIIVNYFKKKICNIKIKLFSFKINIRIVKI